MRCAYVAALLLCASIFLVADPNSTAHALPRDCASSLNISGCPDTNNGVVVESASKGKAKVGEHDPPPGAVEYITCGPQTGSRLAALGDRTAAQDLSANCTSPNRDVCIGRPWPGTETVQAIRVVKQGDGTWQYNGGACLTREPAVTAAAVRARAVRLIPPAALGLAPHGTTLVNIER